MILKKLALPMVVVAMAVAMQSGCNGQQQGMPNGSEQQGKQQEVQQGKQQEEQQGNNLVAAQKAVMAEFDQLVATNADVKEIKQYVDSNIAKVSKAEASRMIIGIEKAQKEYLPNLEEKFYRGAGIQEELFRVYQLKFKLNNLGEIRDQETKRLLAESQAGGYKVETAEGSFFPVIDYAAFQQYNARVTADIQAYINLMAAESNAPPAKDAAIVIGWDEVLTRGINQERFLKEYRDSVKIPEVKQLFKRYVSFTLYGADNTPLFAYENKLLPEAITKYTQVVKVKASEQSELGTAVQEFLAVVEQNQGKLTNEVISYRKQLEEKLISGPSGK